MKMYWFSEGGDNYWAVVVARDEESAWRRLLEGQGFVPTTGVALTDENVRGTFVIKGITSLDGQSEGLVATILAGDGSAAIEVVEKPGDEMSLWTAF